MNKNVQKLNWSYLAGFFDGEGCICFTYQKGRKGKSSENNRYLIIQISMVQCMSNKKSLLKIANFLSKQKIYFDIKIDNELRNPKWENQIRLRIRRREDMKKFLIKIGPFLINKRLKCLKSLKILKGRNRIIK